MGACQFENHVTVPRTTSDDEAFKSLIQNSKLENGHRFYTGTIAEKHGFKMLHRAKSEANAKLLVQQLMGGFSLPTFGTKIRESMDDKTNPAFAIRYPVDKKTDGIVFFGYASE